MTNISDWLSLLSNFLLVYMGPLRVKKLIEFEQKVMDLIFDELAS